MSELKTDKRLLLGNAAVARGLWEAGVSFVSSYPGTPSTEVTEELARYDDLYSEWAPNEKVAMESAFGASLAGVRSFCGMKHVGLNVAADPLFTISYTGVNAGMVIAVADDPGMHSSQNEQDSRHYAQSAKLPMLEPSDSEECLSFAKEAFRISEEFDTPVLLRLCTRIAHSQSIVSCSERVCHPKKVYEKNAQKFIMTPANAIRRHPEVEKRTAALTAFAESCSLNREELHDPSLGIICSGTCYQYAKEVFGSSASYLKLGMVSPLPVERIRRFAAAVKRLVVIEELDPVIETHCRSLGVPVEGKELFSLCGELSQNQIAAAFGKSLPESAASESQVPVRPPVMCAGCPHRGMFYTLAKNKYVVLGDIGCYTLGAAAPLNALDSTICMGASVSGLHGFLKAGGAEGRKTVCVIGDSTFMHSGVTGLINVAYNGSPATVIILDNSITGMTGHQQNPTTGKNIKGDPAGKIDLEALCRSVGIEHVRVVDPYDLKACQTAVKEESEFDGTSVIISRRPCALLKDVKHKPPLKPDVDSCIGCKACMRIGCPALSIRDGKIHVDAALCVGCGVCSQLCPKGVLKEA